MKKPKIKNIIILGKFSDKKIRQILCNKEQQLAVLNTMAEIHPEKTIHVLDKEIDGVEWDSET